MTKQEKHRYIDSKNTVLYTINNLYDSTLMSLNLIRALQSKEGLTEKRQEDYKQIARQLYDILLFGNTDAVGGLSYLYKEGLGVEKDEYKAKLFIAIGANLGHKGCQKLMHDKDYGKVNDEANAWAKVIKKIEKKYPDKDVEVTMMMTIDGRSMFNAALPGKLTYYSIENSTPTSPTPSTSTANNDPLDYIAVDLGTTTPDLDSNYENIQVKKSEIVLQVAIALFSNCKKATDNSEAHGFLNSSQPFFKEAFALGMKEAAIYLAYISFVKDNKSNSSYETSKLYIAVGDMLGDPSCRSVLEGENISICNMKNFLESVPNEQSYSPTIKAKASKIAKVVKQNYEEYFGKDLTISMVQEAIKRVKEAAGLNITASPSDHAEDGPSSSYYVAPKLSNPFLVTSNPTFEEQDLPEEISLTGDVAKGCCKCVIQ